MIRFASLGSGSKGNATLIESGETKSDTRILLDCGFSVVEIEKRLLRLGREANTITAIVLTHEHSDHVSGAGRLSRKYNIPVWLTAGTAHACKDINYTETNLIDSHASFEIDDLQLHPFPVPHDAREPCQFVFSDGASCLGVATDFGYYTPHILKCLDKLDALLLECNYDHSMLLNGTYPRSLKERVAGHRGHLDNQHATQLLHALNVSKLKHIIGMHVSEKNNKQEFALNALCQGMNCEKEMVSLASQTKGFDWRAI